MKQLKNLILLLLLTVAACKQPGPSVYTGSKINTALNCHNHALTTYTYDDNGNTSVIQVQYGTKTVFTYANDSIVEDVFNGLDTLIEGYVYYINNQVADSAHGLGAYQKQTLNFSYDGNYMLTEIQTYGYNSLDSTINFDNGNKNVISIERVAANNNTHFYDYFDYYLSNGNSLGNQAIGENFMGTQTANLLKDDVQIDNNGDTSDIIIYRYRYDTSGRPDTVSRYSNRAHPGMQIDSFVYTYY